MQDRIFLIIGLLLLPVIFILLLARSVQTAVAEPSGILVIDAVLYDGLVAHEPDEAVQIRNVGQTAVSLQNWSISDDDKEVDATITATHTLAPGAAVWLADEDVAFQKSFGFLPDYAVVATLPGVLTLDGKWPGYANAGDEVILMQDDVVVDCLVYGDSDGSDCTGAWSGTAVQPYRGGTIFALAGQVLYRKRNEATGLPIVDTDSAADWAQDAADTAHGRRVRYPGWDLETYWTPMTVTATAVLTVAIAPDNAYDVLATQIGTAVSTIQIAAHTFENLGLADALIAAAQRGVTVKILLEGEPPGGISDQELYICEQLHAVGAACWFMFTDDDLKIFDRYTYQHAKYLIIDDSVAAIMSENLSPNSLPYDEKSDGTYGRRGVALLTDESAIVEHLAGLFAHDLDAANHVDVVQWQAGHPDYGQPAPAYVPITVTGGTTYTVRYPEPLAIQDTFAFELVQSPDNSLHTQSGLIGLVSAAGAGDEVLVEQLSERPYWGGTTSNAAADPNLRLEAYINAARRGARVRILLDAYFDDRDAPTSNWATCAYVEDISIAEGLDLACALGNPTGAGIHNKMVLVSVDGVGTVHIGSINGTEMSNKGNRELALQVQSNEAYQLLAEMFGRDWPHDIYLPMVLNNYRGPATHLLISEVLYNPAGMDDDEFIELVNPTGTTIDLSNYSLGDAVHRSDFEDVRRFPAGTTLAPQATLVVATSAAAFYDTYQRWPNFEILETATAVANLIDDPAWGDPATFLQLGNSGDEVLLRNANEQVIDVVVYGGGSFPNMTACPLVTTIGASLERMPYWRDTDDCVQDFREWPFPSPGTVP